MEEETHRFAMFIENLKMADHRNDQEAKNGGSAVHGITRFSDMSQAEFEAQYLTLDPSTNSNVVREYVTIERPVDTTAGLVDWTGKYTTPVKDQGYCGSCWAFSATEQIESDYIRQFGQSYVLSAEQITQCTQKASGCNGGWPKWGFDYIKSVKGQVTDANYPYTSYNGVTGTCKVNTASAVVAVSSYSFIQGESQMASYVQSTGPVSICVDASTWSSYKGGIMTTCGKNINHAVQAVGVDASSNGYWKVRNTWGTSWGESGFIRLSYGHNTCGLTYETTYTKTAKA
jgi:C1A family cysteine protease